MTFRAEINNDGVMRFVIEIEEKEFREAPLTKSDKVFLREFSVIGSISSQIQALSVWAEAIERSENQR
jgi:hypothetical protein